MPELPQGKQPVLSICVPTKNRRATLFPCVRGLLGVPGALEVVVLDTSDQPLTSTELEELGAGDPRLTYVYRAETLSFSATFDAVIQLAGGDYVTIIGDDDCVLPSAVEWADYARRHKIDAITPTIPASYNWPNFRHKHYGDADAALLGVRAFTNAIEYLSVARELAASAASGFQRFDRLPRIYYGIVATERLQELRAKAGGVFFGSSPDISGAVGLANVVRSHLLVDMPVFLPGSSASSGAGVSGMKKHVGGLTTSAQTAAFADGWPEDVPPLYAVQTVWAQAALATLDRVDVHGAKDRLDVGSLHGQTLVHNPTHAKLVIVSLLASARRSARPLRVLTSFVAALMVEAYRRARGLVWHRLNRGYYGYVVQSRHPDVAAAAEALASDPLLRASHPPDSAS